MKMPGMRAVAAATAACALALTGCSSKSHDANSHSEASGSHGSPSSSSSTSVGPVTGKPGSVTIGTSGDFITQPDILPVARQFAHGHGYNYAPFFTNIKRLVEKPDISICQLEGPVMANDTSLSYDVSFGQPREIVPALKNIGFDGCSTANNHTFDRQMAGVISTRQVMAESGLKAAGPSASPSDNSGEPVYYEAGGFKIAQLAYSFVLTNTLPAAPANAPWMKRAVLYEKDPSNIIQDAKKARQNGADLVVVSLHWGIEYKTQPDADQLRLAQQILKSGQVDWIMGNHPHAMQPCQKIDGRYVNYALSNNFGAQSPIYRPTAQQGAFATVTFTRDAKGKITESETFQPLFDEPTSHIVDLATPTSHASHYRSVVNIMGSMGCDAKPAS